MDSFLNSFIFQVNEIFLKIANKKVIIKKYKIYFLIHFKLPKFAITSIFTFNIVQELNLDGYKPPLSQEEKL